MDRRDDFLPRLPKQKLRETSRGETIVSLSSYPVLIPNLGSRLEAFLYELPEQMEYERTIFQEAVEELRDINREIEAVREEQRNNP